MALLLLVDIRRVDNGEIFDKLPSWAKSQSPVIIIRGCREFGEFKNAPFPRRLLDIPEFPEIATRP